MSGFLLRIIINALLLFLVVVNVPGIFVDTLGSTLAGAAFVGFANAVVRPLMSVMDLPFSWQNIGALTFITNLFTPLMVIKALPGFQFSGLLAPAAGIVLLTVCSSTLSRIIRDR